MHQLTLIPVLLSKHSVLPDGLALVVNKEADLQGIGQAENEEAVIFFQQYYPDVTLMDLCLLETGGAEAINVICIKHSKGGG